MLCSRQNNYIQSEHLHTLHLATVWMDRLINNIIGSMVLSLSENIVCHFRMSLYRLRVIKRFLKKKRTTEGRTNWVTSSLLEQLIAAKNKVIYGCLPYIHFKASFFNPFLHGGDHFDHRFTFLFYLT